MAIYLIKLDFVRPARLYTVAYLLCDLVNFGLIHAIQSMHSWHR